MSIWRRTDVDARYLLRTSVSATSFRRNVPAGPPLRTKAKATKSLNLFYASNVTFHSDSATK